MSVAQKVGTVRIATTPPVTPITSSGGMFIWSDASTNPKDSNTSAAACA
jgi:hypothetical protein